MSVLEIDRIERSSGDPRIAGFAVDAPMAGATSNQHVLKIAGWVVARGDQAEAIELVHDGVILRRAQVNVARPDVGSAFPNDTNDRVGFWTLVGTLGLPLELALDVVAVLGDGRRTRLATIHGTREPVRSGYTPAIQPLLVTSLGRTGTTWLMRLLAAHPEIIAMDRYPLEARVGRFWMHALKVLTEPANLLQSSHPDRFQADRYFVGHNPMYAGAMHDDLVMGPWYGRTHVESMAAFFQRTIDDYHRHLATSQQRMPARYFAEKGHPDQLQRILWELYPAAREVFLVRDPRDMTASMLAFNRKRGEAAFGADRFGDEGAFIVSLRGGWLQLLRAWRARGDRAHLVRYEDLVREPVETLAPLFRYADLDGSRATVDAVIETATEAGRAWAGRHRTTETADDSIGRWQRDLSPRTQALCADTFAEFVTAFGYDRAGA